MHRQTIDRIDPPLARIGKEPAGTRKRRGGRRRRWIAATAVLVVISVPAASYAQALAYRGSAPVSARTVEWIRDHGGSPVVDAVENYWYSTHVPTGAVPTVPAGQRISVRSGPVAGGGASAARADGPAPVLSPLLSGTAPGEGSWLPGRSGRDGRPALYTTFFRPDPRHPGVVAGAAWMRAGSFTAHLVAGTREPDTTVWPGGSRVPPSDVPSLLATFNAGFKFRDTPGGFLLAGRTARPLVDGLATAVIDDTGRLRVGALGADIRPTDHVVAARQNLHLILRGGRRAPGLESNAGGQWGTARNQSQFTWRSAIGTDVGGNLLFVGGNGLDLVHLADALAAAGAVQGMELDMHRGMVSFASWTPVPAGLGVAPTKLLPDMTRVASRYLVADQRDFFYLTLSGR